MSKDNDPVPEGLIEKVKDLVHKELDKQEGKK